jgi:hypothetical protein
LSLAGKLEDVPLADVMQFIHLGRRTGTLTLERGSGKAEVNFHRGAIVGAWSPSSRRLGELLLEEGILDRTSLERALELQGSEQPRRSLGQILLASGMLEVGAVRDAVRAQIERTIYELVTWSNGSFVFELDTLKPVDDIAIFPGDLIPDIDLNTQMVLLEAARIFDERNRSEGLAEPQPAPTSPPRAPTPSSPERAEEAGDLFDDTATGRSTQPLAEPEVEVAEAGEEPTEPAPPEYEGLDGMGGDEAGGGGDTLQLVAGGDEELAVDLSERLQELGIALERVEARDAGAPAGGTPAPIVVFELRPGETRMEDLAQVCRRRPGLPVVCVLEDVSLTARAYEAGAAAVVPRDLDAVVGCVASMTRFRNLLPRPSASEATARAAFAKLRRVVSDLRSGVFSASVALNLMNVIAESVERAVLFLVRRNTLTALGAFGFDQSQRPLAEVTRGLSLSLEEDNALTDAIRVGRALSVSFDDASLPDELVTLLGRPSSGQVVVFPVLGSERVILLIYTDNGTLDRPIEEIDIIDLAAAEVGIAFENELLRRQLAQQRK